MFCGADTKEPLAQKQEFESTNSLAQTRIPISNLIYFPFHKVGKREVRNVSKFSQQARQDWKLPSHSLTALLIGEATHFDNEGEGGLRDSLSD